MNGLFELGSLLAWTGTGNFSHNVVTAGLCSQIRVCIKIFLLCVVRGYLASMKIEALHIGMSVRHPQYGLGTVKTISEVTAEIHFNDGKRTVEPNAAGLQPAEPQMAASGLEIPLKQFVEQTVADAVEKLGLEMPDSVVGKLGLRWNAGKMVLYPADASLQSKEVPLETFFHKIVMVRNNLRVLEQKINAHEKLSDGEKVEMQQYITRCYGSLTTFNVLFKDKEDQF